MRVTRLEIFGFKSFMERLVLPLEGGITGVVGPNGCGKSNIVDAIRWVLGETRAKNLRGGVLEDVIFNGTDKLRPLGLAEVTLTLRSSGPDFFADLLHDESELFDLEASLQEETTEAAAKTEIPEIDATVTGQDESISEIAEEGRPKLTVIQGNLGQTPESKVIDCDIPLPKQKRIDANQTLLTRFSWLKATNEVQVTRRLYRSGESEFFVNRVSCRLKDLKDLFRAVGLGAKAYTIVAQGEVARIISAKPEERRLILEEAAGVIGFRDKISAASRRLEETEVNISRLEDIAREVSKQVQSLKRQAARAESRAQLKAEISTMERALYVDRTLELSERRNELDREKSHCLDQEQAAESAMQRVQAEEEAARGNLMQVDVEGDTLRTEMESIQEELHNRARQRGERNSRLAELRAFLASCQAELNKLSHNRETLTSRRTLALDEAVGIENEASSLGLKIADLRSSLTSDVESLRTQVVESRNSLRQTEAESAEVKAKLSGIRAELKVVDEQLVALEPVAQLKASITEAGSGGQLLIDGISVPAELRSALQSALGERAGFLVSKTPLSLAQTMMGAMGNAGETARGIGVIGPKTRLEVDVNNETSFAFPRLYDLLQIDESVRVIAFELLRDVYVAENYLDAITYFSGPGKDSEIVIVTKAGDLVTSHTFYSLRHEGGIVHLKHQARDLRVELANFEARATEIDERTTGLRTALVKLEAQLAEAEARLREREREASALEESKAGLLGRLGSVRAAVAQADGDLKSIAQEMLQVEVKREELESEEETIRAELAASLPDDEVALQDRIRELRASYSKLDSSRKEGREKLSALAEAFSNARHALDDARGKTSHISLELQKLALDEQNLTERMLTEYGDGMIAEVQTAATSAERLEAGIRESHREEVAKLKARIVREGDVDPESIVRYREENERLENLESQQADLKAAAETLKRTIEKLTETSVERFLSVFKGVRENFSKLVPRLFGGGKADLELLDPNNPLDSGVEIIARPPGKKLKSLELLSGGEKALCATALILAMFLERPSPLCVLDEVDAPLDEANLARFLSLIRDMSSRTQFIMITHNKNSMAVSNQLVGVTMQEPGASKVLTVSLQEAYSQVA